MGTLYICNHLGLSVVCIIRGLFLLMRFEARRQSHLPLSIDSRLNRYVRLSWPSVPPLPSRTHC